MEGKLGDPNDFKTCNYHMSVFNGSSTSQIILISAYILLSMFLLTQMCRLCTKVFSYHKFYIHQAYRFYTISFVSTILIIIHRITQTKLNQAEQDYHNETSLGRSDTDLTTVFGWRIINQLMGAVSISVTNIMYVVIGFTWLNIAWGCDFNNRRENISETFQSIDQQPIGRNQNVNIQRKKESLKKKIIIGKNIAFYFVYPVLLLFATYATLQRSHQMCQWALVDLLISSQMGYFLLMYSFILFLKNKLRDPSTSLHIKAIIIYLIVAMTLRCIWFNIIAATGTQQHEHEVIQVLYNIFISVVPILCLSWLSEKELEKEGFTLTKSDRFLLMQSTII